MMSTTGTEAEKPDDATGLPKLGTGTIMMNGQITEDMGLRDVLEIVMADCQEVDFGMLRIACRGLRGNIGISQGRVITGAHVTTTSEYGARALKRLFGVSQGVFAFSSLPEQPIELKQSLTLSLELLLNWRPETTEANTRPSLADAIDMLVTQSGRFDAIEGVEAEPDSALLAWGGEVPVLESTLSRLNLSAGRARSDKSEKNSVEIERIPVPTDFDQMAVDHKAAPSLPDMPVLPTPQPKSNSERARDWSAENLDAIPTPKNLNSEPPTRALANPSTYPAVPRSQTSSERPDDQQRLSGNERTVSQPAVANPSATGNFQSVSSRTPSTTGTQSTLSSRNPSTTGPQSTLPARNPSTTGSQPKVSAQNPSATHQRISALRNAVPDSPKNVDQLMESQRLKAVSSTTFVGDSKMRTAMEMADDEARNKWLLPQIVIGFVLVLLLCQQVFEIIGTHDQFNKGIAATKRGDDSEASVDFSVVLTRQPDNVQAYLYRALCETKLGQSKKALDDYAKVILMQPKNVLGYAGRASLNIKSKKYDEAIMDCDTMAGLQPNYPDALRLRAVAQSKSKRYKEAIEDATRYLTTFSDKDTGAARADVLRTRGYCYYKLKNFDQAAQDYSDAIAADPSNGGTYASRAIVYRELHDWNRALQDANKAATLDPNDTSIFQLRGMCYREQGDSAKALAELDRAVKLTPKVSLFRMRGQARLAVRDFEGAIKDLDYVLSITPDDKEARAWYERARLNLRSNTKSTTSVVADVSSKSDTVVDLKGSPIQLMNRGYLLLKKGDSTEAVELLTAAVRNDPTNAQARRYLAYALDADGDDAAAAKQFSMLQGLGGLQAADQAAYQKILARLKLQADTTKAAPASKTSKP